MILLAAIVGQLFIGSFAGEALTEETRNFLAESELGNIVYFKQFNGLESAEQVRALSEDVSDTILQVTGYPPIIAIDQEGGRVSTLVDTPSAREIFESGSPQLAFETGKFIGNVMQKRGCCLNLAPIADVDSNPDNPVIGRRSFSSNPEAVAVYAGQMIHGMHDSGVATTLKHFPGHGDTAFNSHYAMPIVEKTRHELEACELLPFYCLKDETDAIMTAHVLYPALDPNRPATLSKAILTDLLRNEWGYEGLIISDCLTMRGIAPGQHTFEEAVISVTETAIEAFNAGCDLLLFGTLQFGDFEWSHERHLELLKRVISGFQQAVEEGRIPQKRLESSLERIIAFKSRVPCVPGPCGASLPSS